MQIPENKRELSLESLPQALNAAFSLGRERQNNLDIQIPTQVIKMRTFIF